MSNLVPISSPETNNVVAFTGGSVTMTLKEITDLLGVRHDKAMNKVAKMADEPSFGSLSKMDIQYQSGKGRTDSIQTYALDKRQSIAVASTLNTALLMRVIDRWQELEALAPKVSYSDSLRLLADSIEAKERAEQACLIAEKTKAEIGSRREATAMNTASVAVKKANKLEIELDKSQQYCSIKRMQMIHHGQKFNWRLLKATAIEMNIPAQNVYDANYGTVKAYHADVWSETYAVSMEEVAA